MLKRLSFLKSSLSQPEIRLPMDDGIGGRDYNPPPIVDPGVGDGVGDFTDGATDATDFDGPWGDASDTDAFSYTPDTSGDDGSIDADCADSCASCDSCDSCCSCGEGFIQNPLPCSCGCGMCDACGGCGCGDSYYG